MGGGYQTITKTEAKTTADCDSRMWPSESYCGPVAAERPFKAHSDPRMLDTSFERESRIALERHNHWALGARVVCARRFARVGVGVGVGSGVGVGYLR